MNKCNSNIIQENSNRRHIKLSKKSPEEFLIIVMFPVMCILILIATFTRYTSLFVEHFTWCEELARYLMIYIAFLGIGVAAKNNEHFKMTVFVSLLPPPLKNIVEFLSNLITVVFLGVMTYLSFKFVSRQYVVGQVSAALKLPMWIVYLSIVLGMFDMMVRTAVRQINCMAIKNSQDCKEELA